MNTTQTENSPPTNAQRIDELGRIIMAYSEVTDRLQQSHDQLQETVTTLKAELGEKNRLLERRKRLSAIGEMAAGMAHEIRNPLGGIQLYASLLAKDVADRPESSKIVDKISSGVKHLESLVSQVLQFTRELRIEPVVCELRDIVDSMVELVAPKAEAAEVSMVVDGPSAMPVVVDPVLFGQAVLNLLINAVEAIGKPGAVYLTYEKINAGEGPPHFSLVVRDTGSGIEPANLEKLFNPFFTTKDHGTGLGLAFVHRVVEAHDGTISATNVPGGGAKFEIRI